MNRCRACGEQIRDKETYLWCDKCKAEISSDFKWEWVRHWFDYYFRYFIKHKWQKSKKTAL